MVMGLSTLFGCGAAPSPRKKVTAMPPWTVWKKRFLSADGRVTDNGNGNVSHSEGQGYAMLLAEWAGDRALFDRIWQWTNTTLSRRDTRLFSWRYDPAGAPPVNDPNNATDGDILIAWALLRAGQRWGDATYEQHSRAIRVAIGTSQVVSVYGRIVLLPGLQGFVTPQRTTLNLSYYIWPALDAFREADPDGPWAYVIADGERLLQDARFGQYGLPTDWIDLDPSLQVRPSEGRDPRFGYDAIRIPLYLAWSGRSAQLQPFRDYWADPANQTPWIDVTTGGRANYAFFTGGKAISALIENKPLPTAIVASDDYYSATLLMLARVAARLR